MRFPKKMRQLPQHTFTVFHANDDGPALLNQSTNHLLPSGIAGIEPRRTQWRRLLGWYAERDNRTDGACGIQNDFIESPS